MATVENRRSVAELQLRALIREEITLTSTRASLNESELLNEGVKETALNILQTVLAGTAEYGIAAGTLGAGAAGPAPAAETAIDLAFSAESIASTVQSIQTASDLGKEAQEVIQQARQLGSVLQQSREQFYAQVQNIIQRVVSRAGTQASKVLDDIKESLEKLISRVSDSIGDSIKLMIPDAAIGGTVAAGFTSLVSSMSKSAFDTIASLLEKAGKYAQYLLNPQASQKFFSETYEGTIDIMRRIADSISDASIWKKVLIGISSVAAPPMLRKAADMMQEKKPSVLNLLNSIVRVVIPTFFSAVAALQIILKGEATSTSEQPATSPESSDTSPAAPVEDTAEKATLSERRKRQIRSLNEEIFLLRMTRNNLSYG